MKKLVSAVLATAMFVSLSASAANVLKVRESVEINAPVAKVWGLAGDFGNLGAFHPAVAKTEIVECTNNVKGADQVETPAEGKDDATATKTITGVFRGGLDNLKKLAETN